MPILDDALLLIEPKTAEAYAAKVAAEKAALQPDSPYPPAGGAPVKLAQQEKSDAPTVKLGAKIQKKRFYGTAELDPVKTKLEFAQVVDEVLQQFTTKHDVEVRISVEIQADSSAGFDDGTERAVRENCKVLKFTSSDFESE